MKRVLEIEFVLILLSATFCLADVRNVPLDYLTIQEAIDDANDGDTVLVTPGTYTGDGNRDIDFMGKAITVKSEGGPETCIIDCQGSEEEQHRGFYFHYGEDTNSVVQGFTITNGYTVKYPIKYGGGIYCEDSNPRIENCVLTANRALFGGGIMCVDSNTVVANCIIRNNIASVRPPYWAGNNYGSGGGLSLNDGQPIVINCVISGNRSSDYGGGISCRGNPTFINCIVYGNRTGWHGMGGGITVTGGRNGESILRNCIVWGNISERGKGNQIGWRSGGILGEMILNIEYCSLQNDPNDIYILPQLMKGYWISEEPYFANPGYWDPNGTPEDLYDDFWIDGDYHLKSQAGRYDPNSQSWVMDDVTSPCIDAGDPNSSVGDEPEPNGGRINMGAYGGTAEASKSYLVEP
jgi:hypothetical protein